MVFGPHETNLGVGRAFSDRHVAYYAARAAGGCGVVVTETASVASDDWPYERAPLASECGPGWREVVDACHPHGTLVLAGLGHRGLQGSSAYSQSVLWAPSPVADVVTRELPAQLEQGEINSLVRGFADAAAHAVASGVDGVEVDAGPTALLRQFLSPLTNLRDDAYGRDRTLLLGEVVRAVREVLGAGRILALRLSCDELAPWGGLTPESGAEIVRGLADSLDLVTVVRGGPTSATSYRPDAHTPPLFNVEPARLVRRAVGRAVVVVAQGSIVDPAAAQRVLDDGTADLVEMTRAQIADPGLVAAVRGGRAPRPCVLCNQTCLVCDPRNPIVTCIGNPDDEAADSDSGSGREVVVVGGGPAGLEASRVLAAAGRPVRLLERGSRLGGTVAQAAVGGPHRQRLAELTDWLAAECRRLGVTVELDREVTPRDVVAADVVAVGGVPGVWRTPGDGTVPVLSAEDAIGGAHVDGPVLVWDPVGGPIGVAVAEQLAERGVEVAVVTPDPVVGTQLGRTGDLADANGRLQRAGVTRHLRTRITRTVRGAAELENVHTGVTTTVPAGCVVDCGHRLPAPFDAQASALRAGDCVAPRTIAEAVREGRAAARTLLAGDAP